MNGPSSFENSGSSCRPCSAQRPAKESSLYANPLSSSQRFATSSDKTRHMFQSPVQHQISDLSFPVTQLRTLGPVFLPEVPPGCSSDPKTTLSVKACPSVHLVVRLPGGRIKDICKRLFKDDRGKASSTEIGSRRKSPAGCEPKFQLEKCSPLIRNDAPEDGPTDVQLIVHLSEVETHDIYQLLCFDKVSKHEDKDCGRQKAEQETSGAVDCSMENKDEQEQDEMKYLKVELLETINCLGQMLAVEEHRCCDEELKQFLRCKNDEIKKLKKTMSDMFGHLKLNLNGKENLDPCSETLSRESSLQADAPNCVSEQDINAVVERVMEGSQDDSTTNAPLPQESLDHISTSNICIEDLSDAVPRKSLTNPGRTNTPLACLEFSELESLSYPVSAEKVRSIRQKLSQMCGDQYRKVICTLQEDNKEFSCQMNRIFKNLQDNPFGAKTPPDKCKAPLCQPAVPLNRNPQCGDGVSADAYWKSRKPRGPVQESASACETVDHPSFGSRRSCNLGKEPSRARRHSASLRETSNSNGNVTVSQNSNDYDPDNGTSAIDNFSSFNLLERFQDNFRKCLASENPGCLAIQ